MGIGEAKCWLCRRDMVLAEVVEEPRIVPPAAVVNPLQFSLETLLLIVTLSAVCLGALVAAPGLGVLLLVIAVPALVRTCVSGIRSKQHGEKLTAVDKVMAFLASAAMAWAALMAAGMVLFVVGTVSLFAICALDDAVRNTTYGPLGEWIIWVFVAICSAASLTAFAAMFYITWPPRPTSK